MERLWKPTFVPPAPAKIHRASPAYKAQLLLMSFRERGHGTLELSQSSANNSTRSPEGSSQKNGNENLCGNLEGNEPRALKQMKLFGGNLSVEVTSLRVQATIPEESKKREKPPKKPKLSLPTEESMTKFLTSSKMDSSSTSQTAVTSRSPSSSQSSTQSVRRELACVTTATTTVPSPSPDDFKGIELFCRNAASSKESLEAIVAMSMKNEVIAIVFFWTDGTSTHSVTSNKLCTPSKPCGAWNCSCDKNLRSELSLCPPIGALLLLGDDTAHPYFLPLGPKGW
jgi:hypothetical protein